MEFFDIVDEKGIPTGETIERTQAHKKGIRHRTAHIWIIREQDGKAQLLFQKRSAEKDSFPGRFALCFTARLWHICWCRWWISLSGSSVPFQA